LGGTYSEYIEHLESCANEKPVSTFEIYRQKFEDGIKRASDIKKLHEQEKKIFQTIFSDTPLTVNLEDCRADGYMPDTYPLFTGYTFTLPQVKRIREVWKRYIVYGRELPPEVVTHEPTPDDDWSNIPEAKPGDRAVKELEYVTALHDFYKFLITYRHKPRKETTYQSLFRNPEHPDLVKQILEDNYYTNKGIWAHTGKKNTLATAFYVLSDPEPLGEIHAIHPDTDITSQLIAFYREFKLNLSEKKEKYVYCTIRNAMERPVYDVNIKPDYITFLELFQPLK